jgi:hypothetical protein
MRPANEAARAVEEQAESRGGIKENADLQTMVRTQSREHRLPFMESDAVRTYRVLRIGKSRYFIQLSPPLR